MKHSSTVELTKHYLLITAKGDRNDFSSIVKGTVQMQKAVQAANAQKVLADYRGVNFNVPLTEAFNLVRLYEHRIDTFRSIIMATLVNRKNLELAKFWESICNKRGFVTKVFLEFEEAEAWLIKQPIAVYKP